MKFPLVEACLPSMENSALDGEADGTAAAAGDTVFAGALEAGAGAGLGARLGVLLGATTTSLVTTTSFTFSTTVTVGRGLAGEASAVAGVALVVFFGVVTGGGATGVLRVLLAEGEAVFLGWSAGFSPLDEQLTTRPNSTESQSFLSASEGAAEESMSAAAAGSDIADTKSLVVRFKAGAPERWSKGGIAAVYR